MHFNPGPLLKHGRAALVMRASAHKTKAPPPHAAALDLLLPQKNAE